MNVLILDENQHLQEIWHQLHLSQRYDAVMFCDNQQMATKVYYQEKYHLLIVNFDENMTQLQWCFQIRESVVDYQLTMAVIIPTESASVLSEISEVGIDCYLSWTALNDDPAILQPWLGMAERHVQIHEQRKQIESQLDLQVNEKIEELQLYQTELEMQNTELRETRTKLEVSRNNYLSLYDFAPIGYFTLDQRGVILEVNLTGTRLLNQERRNLIGRLLLPYIVKDDQLLFSRYLQGVFASKEPRTCQIRMKTKDNTIFHAHLNGVITNHKKGLYAQCRTTITDITEYEMVKADLAKSQNILQATFDALQDLVIVIDNKFRVVMSNWKDHQYISEEEREGKPYCYACLMHRNAPCEFCHAGDVFKTGKPQTFKYTNPVDGNTREICVSPIFDDQGNVSMIVEHLRNITKYEETERALRESEQRYRTLASCIPNGALFLVDQDLRFLAAEGSELKVKGLDREDFEGKTIFEALKPNIVDVIESLCRKALAGKEHFTEAVFDERPFYLHAVPIHNEEGDIYAGMILAQNITPHKTIEDKLRRQKEFNETLIQSTPAFFVAINPDRTVRMMNRSMLETLGYTSEEVEEVDYLTTFIPIDEQEKLAKTFEKIKRNEASRGINGVLTKNGNILTIEWHGTPIFDTQDKLKYFFGIGIDITERKLTEANLKQNQTRLSLLNNILTEISAGTSVEDVIKLTLEQIHYHFPQYRVAYSIIDKQGKLTGLASCQPEQMADISGVSGDLNIAPEYLTKLRRQKVVVISDIFNNDIITPDLINVLQAGNTRALLDVPLIHDSELVGLLCFDVDKPHQWSEYEIAILKNVAEYLTVAIKSAFADEEIRNNEKRLQMVIQNMPVMMDAFDEHGNIVVWNSECERVTGYRANEAINNPQIMTKLYPDSDYLKEMQEKWTKMGNDYRDWEWEITSKDGTVKTVSWFNISERFPIAGWAAWGIGVDVTDRVQAENEVRRLNTQLEKLVKRRTSELEQQKELLQVVVDNIPVMITMFDNNGRLKLLNNEFVKKIGWSIEDAAQINLLEVCYPDPEYRQMALEYMLSGDPSWRDFKVMTRDGDMIESIWSNIELSDGSKIGIGIDLSDLKEAEEEIRKLNTKLQKRAVELETTNKELESFSYSVSHDLRAPLRAIEGYSRILQEDYYQKLDEEGQRVLNTILTNADKMRQLIDDLLTFSRLGRKALSMSEIDMTQLVKEVYGELKPVDRNIQFAVEPLPNAHADRTMIRQVWINLISNAIKYTSHLGTTIIEIGSLCDNDSITYYIKDNGVGFDMKYVDKIFGVFQRLHGDREFEGTGVGLALVQRIIHRHGGQIWAEGVVNKGAIFYFNVNFEDNQK